MSDTEKNDDAIDPKNDSPNNSADKDKNEQTSSGMFPGMKKRSETEGDEEWDADATMQSIDTTANTNSSGTFPGMKNDEADEEWDSDATMQSIDTRAQNNDESQTDSGTFPGIAKQEQEENWDSEATLQNISTNNNKEQNDDNENWDTDATLQSIDTKKQTGTFPGLKNIAEDDDSDLDNDIGTDVTLQAFTTNTQVTGGVPGEKPPVNSTENNDEDWDGNEATLQNMHAQNDGDWDGDEATMIGIQQDTDTNLQAGNDKSITQALNNLLGSSTGGKEESNTSAGTTSKNETGEETGATIFNEKGNKPKTKSRGFDAGWHMNGRKGPATGETWGDFEIGGVLGEGGMGLVYRGIQKSLRRRCAVKVLAPHLAADTRVRERFELEAQTTSMMTSPYIVNVLGAGVHGDNNYFAMEFVDGHDLADEIKDRKKEENSFEMDEVARIIEQSCRGLAEAMRNNVVHRDIKPGNLMMTGDGDIKIADFGIVKIMGESSLTMTGQAVGTPSYISPEQGRGDEVDGRSDIYSLGVVMYQLLTGERPFDGTTPNALIYQHNFEEPKMPKELNAEVTDSLQAVCIKMLAKKPENRFQSAEELANHLHSYREGQRLEALLAEKLSTGADEARKENLTWVQRHLLSLVAALVVVAVGGVFGAIWYGNYQEEARVIAQRAEEQRIEDLRRLEAGITKELSDLRLRLQVLYNAQPIAQSAQGDIERWQEILEERPKLGLDSDKDNIAFYQEKINRVAELTDELSTIDDKRLLAFDDYTKANSELQELRQKIGSTDARVTNWTNKLGLTRAHIESQKELIRPIEALSIYPQSDRQRYERILNELRPYLSENDRDAALWDNSIKKYDALLTKKYESLARLDEKDTIIVESVRKELITDFDIALAMLGSDNRDILRWQSSLNRLNQRSDSLIASIIPLRRPSSEHISVAEAKAAEANIPALISIGAINEKEAERFLARLEREITFRKELENRLIAGLNKPAPIEPYRSDFNLYARLVDQNNPNLLRWKSRFQKVDTLKENLAVLDDAQPIPNNTPAMLQELTEILGGEDADIQRWTAAYERTNNIMNQLRFLDRAVPIPASTKDLLFLLSKEIGDGNETFQRWNGKVKRVDELFTNLQPLKNTLTLPENEEERSAIQPQFSELVSLIGLDDENVPEIAERIDVLNGPGKPAWANNYGRDRFGIYADLPIAENNIRFRFIPSGFFTLGSSKMEYGHEENETQINMLISQSYWIAEKEITQTIWQQVMNTDPSRNKGAEFPVERISWDEANEFCTKLSENEGSPIVRLPREIEWERACKAGAQGAWIGSVTNDNNTVSSVVLDENELGNFAWFADNARGATHDVAVRLPNAFGLYDMHGNVAEWCLDRFSSYQPVADYTGTSGEKYVVRGGSWGDYSEKVRASNRVAVDRKLQSVYLGMRPVIEVEWSSLPENEAIPTGSWALAAATEHLETFEYNTTFMSDVRFRVQIDWPKNLFLRAQANKKVEFIDQPETEKASPVQ